MPIEKKDKSVILTFKAWRKLKQSAMDRDITIKELLTELIEEYL